MPENARLLAGSTWVFPGLTASGWREGCLIDTGPVEEVYADTPIEQVVITHGHADHFSRAAALRRAGARVIAAREEVALIENPEVNIRGMFSWAKPSDEMVTRLFQGEGCAVDGYIDGWRGPGIEPVPLAGHTLGHTGFLTCDGVLFTGDALYVRPMWGQHPLPYAIDVGLALTSLRLLKTLSPDWLVPAHGEIVPGDEVGAEIAHHIGRIESTCALVLGILREPRTTEAVIAQVSASLGVVENVSQYWLSVTTVKGYLAYLLERGEAEFYVESHAGWWRAV